MTTYTGSQTAEPLPQRVEIPSTDNDGPSGRDWRGFIISLALVGCASGFWLGSRYPALGDKAQVAADTSIADSLGFDTIVTVSPNDSLAWRVSAIALNWLWANRQGMAFGVIFGALLLTLLPLVRRRGFTSRTANSFVGILIGAPLGVCVNCAAPISHGLARGGLRSESALAAMFSSPTFNVVVISISLSLLPPYMIVIKLAAALLFILVAVPALTPAGGFHQTSANVGPVWLTRLLRFDLSRVSEQRSTDPVSGFWRSLGWTAQSFFANLWTVARLAVPLMVLAAVAGSAMVTVLPFSRVFSWLPTSGAVWVLVGLVLISAIGLALPMPIAFDVVVAGSLWAAGLEPRYVMALFFALGIYSVYSAVVVRVVFARNLAWKFGAVLLLLAVACGLVAGGVETWRSARADERIQSALEQVARTSGTIAVDSLVAATAPEVNFETDQVIAVGERSIQIRRTSYLDTGPTAQGFTRVSGPDIGFADRPRAHQAYNFVLPLNQLGGASAGDVNNDGWDDVVVTSDFGVHLYTNVGGHFQATPVAGDALERGIATNALLLDVDSDGDLDLLAAYFDGTNLLVRNTGDRLDEVLALPAHADPTAFINSFAAADIDRDGRIDILTGWYSTGNGIASNQLWQQRPDGTFDITTLPGPDGQTLTLVATDLDDDGWPDLLVGNDFAAGDVGYRNDGRGNLAVDPSLLPFSTTTTMSYTVADLDGDLANDLYVAQIAPFSTSSTMPDTSVATNRCAELFNADGLRCAASISVQSALRFSSRDRNLASCLGLVGTSQEACLVAGVIRSRIYEPEGVCEPLRATYADLEPLCVDFDLGYFRDDANSVRNEASVEAIRSVRDRNVLMTLDAAPMDWASAAGLAETGWTWDTAAFDANHDGRLDLSVMNGYYGLNTSTANLLLMNTERGGFAPTVDLETFADYAPTTGSVVLDFDNDGDQDLITIPIDGAPVAYRNDWNRSENSIQLSLPAWASSLGAHVTVTAGDDLHRRDVIVGGGYLSFDSQRIHFGLADVSGPVTVVIDWSDGETTPLELEPGHAYQLVEVG